MKGTVHTTLVVFLVIFTVFCLVKCFAAVETVTITTYYPAPYGVYRDLNVTGTLFVDSTNAGGTMTNGIIFTGLAGSSDNSTIKLVNLGTVTDGGYSDSATSELRIETRGSYLDRVYIGGAKGFGAMGGGASPGGLAVEGMGNAYLTGVMVEHADLTTRRGCIRVGYSADSGNTYCPTGSTRSTTTGDTFSNAPHPNGGYFWCCY